jgi:hypothetical protein
MIPLTRPGIAECSPDVILLLDGHVRAGRLHA